MTGTEKCIYSQSARCVIDVLREDGKTGIYCATLEMSRKRYPDAEG